MSDFQGPLPVPGPSVAVWEQDGPIAGEDERGRGATQALATVPQGITTVRDVPTLAAAANGYAVADTKAIRVLGRTPQRRNVVLVASVAPAVAGALVGVLNVDQSLAEAGVGLFMHHGIPVPLTTAGEIWFRAFGNGVTVTFWADIDVG